MRQPILNLGNGQLLMNNYCVYVHINKINKKLYIGITKNINKRWKAVSYKRCKLFYKAILKYGWDNFDHIVIIDNISKEMACEIEKQLIKKYKSTEKQFGYNLATGGDGGATMVGEKHILSKKVFRYDLDGNYIDEWINAQNASKELNICVSDIHAVARREIKQAGGFQWSYTKVDCLEKYPGHWGFNKKQYPKIYQINFDGVLVHIHDDIHNIDYDTDTIRACCQNKRLTAFGFFWLFENDYSDQKVIELITRLNNRMCKKICVYNLDGKLLDIFQNKDEASEKYNMNKNSIIHACNPNNNTHKYKDLLWYYYNDESKPYVKEETL